MPEPVERIAVQSLAGDFALPAPVAPRPFMALENLTNRAPIGCRQRLAVEPRVKWMVLPSLRQSLGLRLRRLLIYNWVSGTRRAGKLPAQMRHGVDDRAGEFDDIDAQLD